MRLLTRPVTYLRLVFLLLGSGLAIAFGMLDLTLISLVRDARISLWLAVPLSAAIVVVPPVVLGLLPPARQLEGVAAQSLLGVSFPDGAPGPSHTTEQRVRATGWFLLHLLAGAVVAAGLVVLLPVGVALIPAPFTLDPGGAVLKLDWLRTTGQWVDVWMPVAGLAGIVAAFAAPLGLGAALARLAPALLGPSYAERLQRLEAETARLAERNRIAREIHDSVGHALSLITLQSGAARKLLHRDPGYADDALLAIETASRSATEDLDHMLGLLRDGAASRAPAPDLGALSSLVAATRAAGLDLAAEVSVGEVPRVVSREAYRIVQEGLTNALRHATGPASLRVATENGRLRITISNPASGRAGRRGRGLIGIQERAYALRGSFTAGAETGEWRLVVDLPLGEE
jgi:signal transduction histidine kinase